MIDGSVENYMFPEKYANGSGNEKGKQTGLFIRISWTNLPLWIACVTWFKITKFFTRNTWNDDVAIAGSFPVFLKLFVIPRAKIFTPTLLNSFAWICGMICRPCVTTNTTFLASLRAPAAELKIRFLRTYCRTPPLAVVPLAYLKDFSKKIWFRKITVMKNAKTRKKEGECDITFCGKKTFNVQDLMKIKFKHLLYFLNSLSQTRLVDVLIKIKLQLYKRWICNNSYSSFGRIYWKILNQSWDKFFHQIEVTRADASRFIHDKD